MYEKRERHHDLRVLSWGGGDAEVWLMVMLPINISNS